MRRTRYIAILLTAFLMMLTLIPTAAAEEPLRVEDLAKVAVTVDGAKLSADAYIVNDRTVAPLRAIFTALGATVEWNGETRTVTATKGTTVIKLTIDQTEAYVGSKTVTLAVPPIIINGSTYVPVRFISEALGADVTFDGTTRTVVIQTGLGCKITGGQRHEGTIAPGGETWGLCGSPHIVSGDFRIEGKDNPVLTIEAGVLVQFEDRASFTVGKDNPGGLLINGTAEKPVTLTSARAGAMPGSWNGISFHKQTLRDQAVIQNARIQYAGGTTDYTGAIYAEGQDTLVEVQVTNTEITNSLFAGINLWSQARLSAKSANLTITGTKQSENGGGFPIITSAFGSNKLPTGKYTGNDLNAVELTTNAGEDYIASNTTWSNIGIPYASAIDILVQGNASPTLTIDPGVVTLWKDGRRLIVGKDNPGTLIADAKAKPEGGGDWKGALDAGLKLATSSAMSGVCNSCGTNKAIVFGPWSDTNTRGSWDGLRFMSKAGDKSKLNGVVVAYAGKDQDYEGGIYAEATNGTPLKFQLSNSLVTGSARIGLELWGNTAAFAAGSTGNYFTGNAIPLRLFPEAVGSLEAGNTFTGNDNDWISVWTNGGSDYVTKTATWRNHAVPYFFEVTAMIGGSSRPVVTIEAGTKLIFAQDAGLQVGADGVGSLVAKGTAAKPITFTSETGRAGSWAGLKYEAKAGSGNALEYVTLDGATTAITLAVDLGASFAKNVTIKNSSETAIYRYYGNGGTDYTQGFGNTFEGNAADTNAD